MNRVALGKSLTRAEAAAVFGRMTSGEMTEAQMGAFLMALRVRGETIEEIAGAVSALRSKMIRVAAPADAMDVVGTGGDSSGSYNISTCAAFIVAGAEVPVAKHGNRALSSRSGAADVLAALGVEINLTAAGVERCIAESGIGFMFAPGHHPALKHVASTRAELGTRTIFNLLGPLLNPAGVRRHLVGVFSRDWLEPMANALGELGSERAFVVHGSDGLDEVTTSGTTYVAALEDGRVRMFEVTPEEAGLPRVDSARLTGGRPEQNAEALLGVINGETGPYRDVALFNAAVALIAAGKVEDPREGVFAATQSIKSGQARDRLDQLVKTSNKSVAE